MNSKKKIVKKFAENIKDLDSRILRVFNSVQPLLAEDVCELRHTCSISYDLFDYSKTRVHVPIHNYESNLNWCQIYTDSVSIVAGKFSVSLDTSKGLPVDLMSVGSFECVGNEWKYTPPLELFGMKQSDPVPVTDELLRSIFFTVFKRK